MTARRQPGRPRSPRHPSLIRRGLIRRGLIRRGPIRRGLIAAMAVLGLVLVPTGSASPAPALIPAPGQVSGLQGSGLQGSGLQGSGAQSSGERPPSATGPSISFLSQSPWVDPDGTFELGLDIKGASATDRLDLTVFPRITGRTRFDDAIRGENLGQPLASNIHPFALADYPPATGPTGIHAAIPVAVDETPAFGVQLTQAGVYPVQVSVTDEAGSSLAAVTTFLLRLPPPDSAPPLAFALIVPMHAAPALQPDGTTAVDAGALARIDAAVDAIGRHPTVPLTLAPTPETLDAIATLDAASMDTAPGPGSPQPRLPRVSSLVTTRQILGRSYVELDLGAWVAAPAPANTELDQQFILGAEAVAAQVGIRPDTRTVLTDRTVSPETLKRFQFTGTHQLVVPESQLGPLTGSSSAVPFQSFDIVNGGGQPISAISTSDALVSQLTETADPVLNGHLVLADLAFTWATTGTVARGTVLAIPADLPVPAATYGTLLDGLADRRGTASSPMVSAVTVDDLFRVTSAAPGRLGSPLVRPYNADEPGSLGSLADRATASRSEVASYRSMLPTSTWRADALDRRISVAEAAGLSDASRNAYFEQVASFIDTQLAGIVAPDNQRVTLTAENGELPVTVENSLDYEVDVKVSISSVKLDFPDGNTRTVTLAPASTTRVSIPVSTRATGAFPVDITVRTPDDQRLVASARFTVRSTAISGIGLILSISAGAFLLLWWILHFRKTRRAKRLVESNHPARRT